MTARAGAVRTALAVLMGVTTAVAQQSASYHVTETGVSSGGNPTQGSALSSSHFHIRLDAIGEHASASALHSASFHADEGSITRYPPPGEVTGLLWSDRSTLRWNPEKSVGRYELYRDLISSLPGTFGSCFASGLSGQTTSDASLPGTGAGFFYLVTARNRLSEEGPKGFRSDGSVEGNPTPCP